MKPCRYIFIVALNILLFAFSPVLADSFTDNTMRTISKEDGLPGETVSKITTDNSGQVWIATSNGVCRYNGRHLSVFRMPHEKNGGNYTYDIAFASDGGVCAATKEGIYRLRHGDKDFKKVFPDIKRAETILCVGDVIFVGNRQGLHVLKEDKQRTITVGSTPMGIENGIRDIRMGADGNVWFISRYGLHQYNLRTGRVKSYDIAHLLPKRSALAQFLPVRGHFFIGTKNNGLYIYTLKTRKVTEIKGVGNTISSIEAAPNGNVTVSGGGAFLLNGYDGRVLREFKRKDYSGEGELPTDAVYCYYRDSNGVDWFGFYRYGFSYTYHTENLFKIYKYGNFNSEGLDVRSVLIHGKQKVIGTADDLWLIDESRNIVRHYTSSELGDAHAISTLAYFNGCYYMGSYDSGIRRFSATSFEMLPNPDEPLLKKTTVGSMMPDRKGNLWIGTGEGLFILDSNDKIRRYTENNSKIIGGVINALCLMPNNNVWIGGPNGICIYNSLNSTFEKDNFPSGFFNGFSQRGIRAGHNGLYFFNTNDAVYYSDVKMSTFGELSAPRNLSLNNCVSFLDDFRGHYWTATEDGLFCVDYKMEDVLHFGYGEGLRCQLIAGQLYLDKDGSIWVCTSNGLMHTKLSDLRRWQQSARYKLILYNIAIDGNVASLDIEDKANTQHRLSLTWNLTSSVMTVRPLLADYSRPYGRLYEYRMDGHKEWLMVRDGEDIRLHHLTLGNHELEVRLAGAPGTLATYKITVYPSVWAVIELILLIAALVAVVLWYRYRKNANRLLAERNDIEEALVEAEDEKQQSELSKNIAEEVNDKDEAPKYEKVHINEDECKDVVKRMRALIEQNKLFTDPNLKMSDVADLLHISSSRLSQIFSLYLNENWYDFINNYRLEEFKRLIDKGMDKRYTLLALSAKCGFKKSSFFTTFRKVENMTPTEYVKKVKK